jgi:peptidoglycan/LPS O-acetylase OafA/YrhL
MLTIPFLFALTRHWRWDALCGHLAYPVYLSHMWVQSVILQYKFFPTIERSVLSMAATLLVSLLLYGCIDRPMQRLRFRLRGEKN